jgi:hypothetical protein
MTDLAEDSEKVLKENFANADTSGERERAWWKLW